VSHRFLLRLGAALLLPLLLALTTATLARSAEPVPTLLTVHVVAHDAKLIGDDAGGAEVVVRDARTGEVLARGVQWGGTGSTDLIMARPHVRGESLYTTDGAAVFTARLALTDPTWVTVAAAAPLGHEQAVARAEKTLLVLPGHDITGDGIVLELQGLIVSILTPTPAQRLFSGSELDISAEVKLLCTCPITPDRKFWLPQDYVVRAELLHRGEVVDSCEMPWTGKTGIFGGKLTLPEGTPGKKSGYTLRVTAANDAAANYGMDELALIVQGIKRLH